LIEVSAVGVAASRHGHMVHRAGGVFAGARERVLGHVTRGATGCRRHVKALLTP
jgi:hypothetical protein